MRLRFLISQSFCSYYKPPLHLQSADIPSFKFADLTVQKAKTPLQLPPMTRQNLVFGSVNSDHMLQIDWDVENGWGKPYITPFHKLLQMHPFVSSFHYAVQCYEGMKAYKDSKGKVRLYRPECNMYRFKKSSYSLCLPDFDGNELLKCIKELVKLDERWIPSQRGFGLYIRPFHISMEPTLGVKEAKSSKIVTVLNPVGPYYESGFEPIRLFTEVETIRSAPGGYGSNKVGGNYGPTILASKNAKAHGYSQCLFLFNGRVVQVGSSNIFFVIKGKDGVKQLHTPLLQDELILAGITRDSELTKQKKGYRVVERRIMIDEIVKAFEQNKVLQIFCTGTAVIISPVKELTYNGVDYKVPVDPVKKAGDLAYELFNEMIDIQTGNKPHPWSQQIN